MEGFIRQKSRDDERTNTMGEELVSDFFFFFFFAGLDTHAKSRRARGGEDMGKIHGE